MVNRSQSIVLIPFHRSVQKLFELFGLDPPSRPEPIFSFFPLYSPFKLDDNDGFDLGEDNCIKAISIEDRALRFELSAVLRPGRFLGNHYLAFTVPNRTFIITLDRVKEGIKAARKTKRAARAMLEASKRNQRWRYGKQRSRLKALRNNSGRRAQPKSFFSRFVDGYLQAERDDEVFTTSERVTTAIRDFFGRQGEQQRQYSPSSAPLQSSTIDSTRRIISTNEDPSALRTTSNDTAVHDTTINGDDFIMTSVNGQP